MGISVYKIKKWYQMLVGKSISHVDQGVGTCYCAKTVAGYYNDLTEKVTKDDPNILVPEYYVDTGEKVCFAIGVFQYGLAAYDLLLTKGDEGYKEKLIACADWAVEHQQEDGGWNTFFYKYPEHPYSSMSQGEGISMLIRAHIVAHDEKYMEAARKALDFMVKPICEGGTTCYSGEDVYLYEYTHESLVLNGWIFSLWGLFDYCKYTGDEKVRTLLDATLKTLKKKLPDFDIKYWSKYEDGKKICSPFYHKLHIAQLTAMYELFGDEIYKEYAQKWTAYQNSFWKPKRAFVKKTVQKVLER